MNTLFVAGSRLIPVERVGKRPRLRVDHLVKKKSRDRGPGTRGQGSGVMKNIFQKVMIGIMVLAVLWFCVVLWPQFCDLFFENYFK